MSHVPPLRAPVGPDPRRPRWVLAGATFALALLGALIAGMPMRMGHMRGRMGPMADDSPAIGPEAQAALFVVALGLGACVALASRRPRAGYVGAVALVASYLLLGGVMPLGLPAPAITLATVWRRRPQSEWLAWALLLLPALAASFLRDPAAVADDPIILAGAVFFGVAWVVLPASFAQLAGARRAAAESARSDELRRVAYEERLRVARDIHDVVGHSLSMISLQSGVALRVLDSNPGQARASLEAIRDASKSSLAELRHTLGVFRQPDEGQPLDPTPSLASLPALVESVRASGRDVGLRMSGDAAAGVPLAVQTVAYRVVQEALTNVVRHAPSSAAVVTVGRSPGALTVSVHDSGPATAVPAEGNGLRGMRERVASVGGRLSLTPRPGGGLAVEATLPLGVSDE